MVSMPELPYGAPPESDEPIPRDSLRYKTYSWGRLAGTMPHQSVALTVKEVTGARSIASITVSSPIDAEQNKDAAGKDAKSSGLLRIMTCGAGLFSDGYLSGVRALLE